MKKVIEIFRGREELNKLVNSPNPKYKSGIRSRAILALLCFAALRVSELVNLRPEDIRKDDNCVYINNSKYNSSRVVYIPDYVFTYIRNWLVVKQESEYLFCSRYKKKLCTAYIQKMVKRYAKRIDINKNIHPHCLRHSIATIWLKEGKPVTGIQKQLGHTSLSTTQIYMDYFNDDRKNDFIDSDKNIVRKIEELGKELEKLKSIING